MAEESPVAESPQPEEYTTTTRTLDPRVRLLWIIRALVVAGVFGGAVAVAGVVTDIGVLPAGIVFGVLAVLGIGHALLLFRSWQYEVREDALFLEHGVVRLVTTVVPNVRVQHIDVQRGPLERLVGISSLVVYTAGSRGADVTVPGLTPNEAADLQERLKALTIESAEEDAV